MRIKPILWITIILLSFFLSAKADISYETLKLEVKFAEYNSEDGTQSRIVICDTIMAIKGKMLETFCGNLSLDVTYNGLQNDNVKVQIVQISLPPGSQTKSNLIESPLNVPFIIDSVLVKGTHVYKVFYTPLELGTLTTSCEYDHRDEGVFNFDPSGDFDIYFITNSLGDFHWNNIRDFLEYELDRFNKIFVFNQPGKINYYLYPCKAPHFAYYKNSDFAIQPSRNSVYQEYSHLTVGIASSASNLLKLYRYWGYAPRFLVEGCAYITKFHQFYCRQYKKDEGLYPLQKMFVSKDYDNLENTHKKRMQAASFVAYLSRTMKLNEFRDLYSQSTDLNLMSKLEEVTGKNIDELERDWLKFVDTLSFKPGLYHFFAQHEIAQSNINEMVYLYEKGYESGADDSTFLELLFNAYYLNGNYEKSAACVRKMSKYYSPEKNYLPMGNMLLSAGHIDSAEYYYMQAEKIDSSNKMIPYKLGQIEFNRGNLQKAKKYYYYVVDSSKSMPIRIDSHYYLGRIFLLENNPDSAKYHFTVALNGAKNLISRFPDNPLYNMRAGEATMCLGELKVAQEYLGLAEFVELRPFYLGRVLLDIGKVHDLCGDRDDAKIYYQHVLDIRSTYYDKLEAKRYMKKPFKLK